MMRDRTQFVASLLISLVTFVVLVISLPKVNGFTLGLIGFMAIPWFFQVIATVTFPGGGVTFRDLKERQDLQGRQLDTLRFLVMHLVPEAELMHLRKLANKSRFPSHDAPPPFFAEIRHLRAMGFIVHRPNKGATLLEHERGDVNDYFEITQAGRDYLNFLTEESAASTPASA